jgi:nucleoside-diphosphate-sugar epimerase
VKLPLQVALALATAAQYVPGPAMPSPVEIRAASLHWAFANNKARRELGWRTSPHEDALEETIDWYREHDATQLAAPGSRQPLALRLAGGVLRRVG